MGVLIDTAMGEEHLRTSILSVKNLVTTLPLGEEKMVMTLAITGPVSKLLVPLTEDKDTLIAGLNVRLVFRSMLIIPVVHISLSDNGASETYIFKILIRLTREK